MSAIKVRKNEVRALIECTFPEYRGRKIVVWPATEVAVSGLNWDGGSRNQFRACDLTGRALGSMDKYNMAAPWKNPAEGQYLPIPQGAVVVEHTISFGKDCGLTIYMNPADVPAYIAQ